jgi:hypothetical protein
LLREPLVVSGELGYLGEGNLDRRVTNPYSETTTIRGNSVRIEREGEGSRSMLLDRAPQLAGFLSAFGALLGGDSDALQKTFSVTAIGDEAGDWELELVPLDDRARRRVGMIAIYGSGEQLRCVTTIDSERTGSVMLLGAEAPPISPASSLDALIAHCRAR